MKRNKDLIDKILLYIEENYVAGQGMIPVLIGGYTKEEVMEHARLAHGQGLIYGYNPYSTYCECATLTNKGFNHIDTLRLVNKK